MIEVEAKVSITRGEYSALRKRLKKEGKYLCDKKNEDTYYMKPAEQTVRIRKGDRVQSFDIKYRETINGIESNIEIEWDIKEPAKWRKVLRKLDINPRVRKTKKTELYEYDGFHIELNEIRLLGYYMEIEKLVSRQNEVYTAKKALIKVFRKLGYAQSDLEPKRYLELLANV